MFPPTLADRPPEFFGRDQELARLRALLEEVRAEGGRGRAALVTGPAGVGKSRLMAEVKRALIEAGEPVFEGTCRTTDHRPYGPLVELLGDAAARMAVLGHRAPCVERALGLIAGLPAPARQATGEARVELKLHFFEIVRRGLLELARVRPPLICVHDLHRADPATLELVQYLLENLLADPAFDWAPEGAAEDGDQIVEDPFPGLLVLTFRKTDATRRLLDVASGSVTVEEIALRGLDAAGVRSFLQSSTVVQRFLEASDGLPDALEQLVLALPDHASALWTQRLGGVPPEGQPVLETMAVYEKPVTPELLQDLMLATDSPVAVLEDLVARLVLTRSIERGEVRFRFVRTGARETFHALMPVDRRAAVHRQIADRLSRVAALGTQPEEIAHHFLAGEAPADALPFAEAAADRLQAAFAYARAAELLERVLPAAAGADRERLLDRLAELFTLGGDLDRARGALAGLLERTTDPERHAELSLRLARVHLVAGAPESALRVVDAALPGCEDADRRRRLAALGAEAAYRAGDLDAAAARCAPLTDAPVDAETLAARNTQGKVHLAREALEEAYELFARNLDDAATLGDLGLQARASINLGVVHLQRGEPGAAAERFDDARQLADRLGDVHTLALSLENLAVLHHRRQEFKRALAFYHESTAAFRKLGHRTQLATTALNLGDLYLSVGELDRARRLADIARDQVRAARLAYLEPQNLMLDGDLARAEGRPAAAAEHYAQALARIERGSGSNQRMGPLLWARAEALLEDGAFEEAAAQLDRAAQLPSAVGDEALNARLRLTRGALWTAAGDHEAARVELTAAAAAAQGANDRQARWRALYRLAEVHWALGDRASTLQSLAEAVEIIELVGADLPRVLRGGYLDTGERREVRDALRRVRAGIAPNRPLRPRPEEAAPAPERRPTARYQPWWQERYPQIIGRAPALFPVFNTLDRVAGTDSMVLIRGESGTGKELVAAALHAHSPRADGPFVKVNCSAFVETLLLSELFGHEKGAFTGAVARKKGRFELADRGTLFLDEIGDISPNTQVALLRVLQEGALERVGGSETLHVDVRVLCATHRNLEEMVRNGEFRADLYYRLRGVIVEQPPLRERRGDVLLLAEHFLSRRPHTDNRRLRFTREALASLLLHDWPGNVRELENVVRSAALFADGDLIGLSELKELGDFFEQPDEAALLALAELAPLAPPAGSGPDPSAAPPAGPPPTPPPPAAPTEEAHGTAPPNGALFDGGWLDRVLQEEGSLSELKKRIEFEAIARALRETGGNITRAAERLGMKRPRLSQIIHATPELGVVKREVDQT